jgi:hypothetical protein
MFNDHLSSEEAKELIRERIKEVESYSSQKQLGFGDQRKGLWIFLLVILLAAGAVSLLF